MDIWFKEVTPDGEVEFSGALKKQEVDWLLRYALLTLLARGIMPASVTAKFSDDDDMDDTPDKGKLN